MPSSSKAVFDAALSAAGTIGSAALAVKSFPAVKHEIMWLNYYFRWWVFGDSISAND